LNATVNATADPALLLLGPEALALGPRLDASGYQPLTEPAPGQPAPAIAPVAVVLSPGCEEHIAGLRRTLGPVPLLLGLRSDSVEGRSHCLEWGADDFWLPTLGPSDLLTRLRLHLGLRRDAVSRSPRPLQVADLRLDPGTRQAWRGPRRLLLTAREYELLLLLLRHHGRVVSRERILDEMWSDQGGGASNVIEVYVRYLRQKLELGGERRLIHTLRGRGYCLSEVRPALGAEP